MSREWKLSIRQEPFWLQEMFACMNYVYALDSEEWLNKNSSWSRRQKEEFLAPYRRYRETMRAGSQPILEQYPLLAGYVDPSPRDQESLRSCEPPIQAFLIQMQSVLEAEEFPPEGELEEQLNDAFQRILGSDLQKSPDAGDPVIHGLPDVMAALEGWDGTDADKFKLLRLYSERREVMEQLWNMREAASEIGRECLKLVGDRFDAAMEKIRNQKEIEALLDAVGLQWREDCIGRITPTVMPYDRIMLQLKETPQDSGKFDMNLQVGIETFYLNQARKEDLYNDDQLLARLKALGDPTRLKILHQLVERPCYLQEMARELELTPATVLHHLGILMEQSLIGIQMTKEKKRVYYQVNEQGLQEVSQGIAQLTLSREEKEARQRAHRQQEGLQKQGGWQWNMQK